MGSSGNSSGMMIMLLMVGGVCFLSLCCSAGLLAAYNMNDSFKDWVQKTFKFGDGKGGDGGDGDDGDISDKAGTWVCPTINDVVYDEVEDTLTDGTTRTWCHGPKGYKHFLASKLRDDAVAGQTYGPADVTWGPTGQLAEGALGYNPRQGGLGGDPKYSDDKIVFTA